MLQLRPDVVTFYDYFFFGYDRNRKAERMRLPDDMFCNTCKSTLLHIFLETAVLQKKKACRLPPTYKFELGISWFSINHRNSDNHFSYEKVGCLKWVLRKRRYIENLFLKYVVKSNFSLQAPFSRGERLIVLHAGSKAGFLKGTELVWKAKSSTGDYHDEMNGDNFFKWVKEKPIPHLPPKSVLIIDNAPYHNLQVDKCPTQASRKADTQVWLTRQQIPFGAILLKAELLQICKQHKPTPSFLLDNILKKYGHDCLRLPAYHADLNSIELIWASMKGYIARRNVSFKMTDVIQLTHEAIAAVTEDDWVSSCRHVEEV